MGITGPPAAQGALTAQQALWQKTFKQTKSHNELDSNFEKLRLAIAQHVSLLQRQAQVRVKTWLKKLSEETANVVWKKNRNAFARLLLEQLRAGRLAEPFHQMPPDGPLPTLPKHATYSFAQPRARSMEQQEQRRLSAAEQLDEYLGRQDFRQLQLEPGEAAEALPVPLARPSLGGAADMLPGTRMQLVGAEARQVDRHQLADAGWQPSKLELEAQLGASRERERELQWRLQQAEEALREQGALLQQALHAPLRLESPSPPPPIDVVIDDEEVSPPRRRVGRRELEELIGRYEERRRQWRIPAWPKQAAGRVSPLQDGEEEEILEHLDNFQRHTDAIRRHLSRRPGADGSSSSFSEDGGGLGGGLSAMSSGLGAGGLGGFAGGSAVGGDGGAAVPSLRSGLEPSLGPPFYPPASPTVVGGVTPATRGGPPARLLATAAAARGRRPRESLFEGLPESPRLGAGRAAAQQPAATTSSAGAGAGASSAQETARPRAASPPIRHTLKSAAAAQKNSASARASPGGAASAGPQPQQRAGGRSPRGAAEPSGQAAGRDGNDAPGSHAQTAAQPFSTPFGLPGSHHHQQQPGQAGGASGWPEAWDEFRTGYWSAASGGAMQGQPPAAPGSNEHLASGVADLRRRLERQLGEANEEQGGAAAPSFDPLASTSRTRGGTGVGPPLAGRRLLPLEESSEGEPRGAGGGSSSWRRPSSRYRLSSEDGWGGWEGPPGGGGGGEGRPLLEPDFSSATGVFAGKATAGGGRQYRLTADSSSGGVGGWGLGGGGGSDASLDDFRRQTDAIKAQLERLRVLEAEDS